MSEHRISAFPLPLPPSSNNRLLWRGRKATLAPAYRAWKQEAVATILETFEEYDMPYLPPDSEYRVLIAINWPDRRRRDIDGPIKAVLDAITESCVAWADDSQVVDLGVKLVCRACEGGLAIGLEPVDGQVRDGKK